MNNLSHSELFLKSGIINFSDGIKTTEQRDEFLEILVMWFGYGDVHHLDDPASNLMPLITFEESELIDKLISDCMPCVSDENRETGSQDFDPYEYVSDLADFHKTN
jgi:hypothetical protein